jgi:hypothetical protein
VWFSQLQLPDQCRHFSSIPPLFCLTFSQVHENVFLSRIYVLPSSVSSDGGSRSLESLDDGLFNQAVPAVDLPVSVDFWNFGLESVFVTSDHEFLSIVVVLVWAVKNEQKLGNLSAIVLLPLEVVHNPSTVLQMIGRTDTYLELFLGMDSMNSSQVEFLSPTFSISTESLLAFGL